MNKGKKVWAKKRKILIKKKTKRKITNKRIKRKKYIKILKMSERTKWNRQPGQQEQVKRKFKNEIRIKKKHEIIKESKKIKKTKEKIAKSH